MGPRTQRGTKGDTVARETQSCSARLTIPARSDGHRDGSGLHPTPTRYREQTRYPASRKPTPHHCVVQTPFPSVPKKGESSDLCPRFPRASLGIVVWHDETTHHRVVQNTAKSSRTPQWASRVLPDRFPTCTEVHEVLRTPCTTQKELCAHNGPRPTAFVFLTLHGAIHPAEHLLFCQPAKAVPVYDPVNG